MLNGDVYSCTEKIGNNSKVINLLESNINVFDIISSVHQVPKELRYTESVSSDYIFKWQSGLGCPWVIEKERGNYNFESQYMTQIYNDIAPILIGLNIKADLSYKDYK